jgi:FkbM family methyltransferase
MNDQMVLSRPPWHFRLAAYLTRNHLRGGTRIIDTARKLGWLDRLVRYQLSPSVSLQVPLYRDANAWDEQEVLEYEAAFIACMGSAIRELPGPVALYDCGADIGIFAVRMVASCPNLQRVTAFEPLPAAHEVLARNLEGLPIPAEARCAAVSDFSGHGRMQSPDFDASDHARFLVAASDGTVVHRIDDFSVSEGTCVALKVDVEGAELNVLHGAREVLERAPGFVVGFEAHRKVVDRTGVDPNECIELLQTIRPCSVTLSEAPEVHWNSAQPFFSQLPGRPVCNVVCRSQPRT